MDNFFYGNRSLERISNPLQKKLAYLLSQKQTLFTLKPILELVDICFLLPEN